MAKGVFTTKVNPVYDDLPEIRYHLPKTYLNQAREITGEWILYYELDAKMPALPVAPTDKHTSPRRELKESRRITVGKDIIARSCLTT